MGTRGNAYRILVENPERTIPLGTQNLGGQIISKRILELE
jgi:hypothetical protein